MEAEDREPVRVAPDRKRDRTTIRRLKRSQRLAHRDEHTVLCLLEAVEVGNILLRVLFAVAVCGAALAAAVQVPAVWHIGDRTR
jgi:hypothetical protein